VLPRVRALLARRGQLGRPGTARGVYYHWQGVHRVLATLADLGYPEGDKALHPIRDRLMEYWLNPNVFREFEARTKAEAYRSKGVPIMRGRYRRCASQQGNALHSVTTLGIADERADSLVERLLHWQWPDGGWNCDRDPGADTSSFTETMLPMVGLAAGLSTPRPFCRAARVRRVIRSNPRRFGTSRLRFKFERIHPRFEAHKPPALQRKPQAH